MRDLLLFGAIGLSYFAGTQFFRAIYWKSIYDWRRDESGQLLIEYCLIVSLICMVSIVALWLSGVNLSSVLHTIASEV